MDLPLTMTEAMRSHAAAESPRECCGLVIRTAGGELEYVRARNRAATPADHFILHEEDFAAAEDRGVVLAIVHSHPHASANPSMADRVMQARSGVPWLIVGWPSGVIVQVDAPFEAPLLGREFAHGVLDCYTLVRDYYARVLGIDLPDFERPDRWWEAPPARNLQLYRRHFASAGFAEVDPGELRVHDGIVMQVLSDEPNHAAVYIGGGQMVHHLYDRLSSREVYGGYWRRHTAFVVRHATAPAVAGDDLIALDGR
jgi:proteasome lid subunit RPN8/RPN11